MQSLRHEATHSNMHKFNATYPVAAGLDFRNLTNKFNHTSALSGRHLAPHADLDARHTFRARRQLRGHRDIPTSLLAHRGVLGGQLEVGILLALFANEFTHRTGTLVIHFVIHLILLNEGHVREATTTRQGERVCIDHMNLHARLHAIKTQHPVVVCHFTDGLTVGLQNQALVIYVSANVGSELFFNIADLRIEDRWFNLRDKFIAKTDQERYTVL